MFVSLDLGDCRLAAFSIEFRRDTRDRVDRGMEIEGLFGKSDVRSIDAVEINLPLNGNTGAMCTRVAESSRFVGTGAYS